MSKVEKAVQFMLDIAKDDSHGYDQMKRWGPDYDCSSLIITAYEQAGIKVKTAGATYTGNMLAAFKKCGFVDVTSKINLNNGAGVKRGDVLLNIKHHTAMIVDQKTIVHASINEKGTATGGKTGDQTGKEICTRSYYNKPWDVVLRYPESESTVNGGTVEVTTEVLKKGSAGANVKSLQLLLNGKNKAGLDVDGKFGAKTETAVKNYQKAKGLEVDGHVGKNTWNKLVNT